MAHAPGPKTRQTFLYKKAESGHKSGKLSAIGSFAGFAITAGVALAILAAIVLLPAWQRMAKAQADRDSLLVKTQSYDQIIDHRRAEADAIKTDPLQTQNILIQTRNYRPAGEAFVPVADGQADQPVMQLLERTDSYHSSVNASLDRAANRIQVPKTRNMLLVLSGLLLTLAVSIFMPTR